MDGGVGFRICGGVGVGFALDAGGEFVAGFAISADITVGELTDGDGGVR